MALSISNSFTEIAARWTEAVSGPRRNRRTSITALDVEKGSLQVAQAATHGGESRIVRFAAAPLALKEGQRSDDPAALGQAVALALKQLRFKPGPVVMSVPRSQAMLRRLDLPPTRKQAEIASMVYFKVGRDLPFRLEEALVDFKVLPEFPDVTRLPEAPEPGAVAGSPSSPSATPARVLAAVVRHETVKHYQTLAQAAGLKLVALGLRSVASSQAVELCYGKTTDGCVALVSIREREVIFDVLWDRALLFSRVGTLSEGVVAEQTSEGGQDSAEDAPIILEVVRSLHSYESEVGHQRVARFLVTGATGVEANVAGALGRRFGVPTQVLDPGVVLAKAEGDGSQAVRALPAMGLALGALDPAGLPFDFLNPKRPPVQRDYGRVRLLGAVAGALALLLSVAGLRTHWIHQREQQLAAVREQVAVAGKNLAAYRTVRSEALALKAWNSGNRNWLDHLATLSRLLPDSRDIYVTTISTSIGNTVNLAVRARSSEIVDRTCSALRAAGYQVRPPAITPVSDHYGYHVQANLEVTVPKTVTTTPKHS